jgi:hypothetical protein
MTNPVAVFFTNTHLHVQSPDKLTPEFDKYLTSKGFNTFGQKRPDCHLASAAGRRSVEQH